MHPHPHVCIILLKSHFSWWSWQRSLKMQMMEKATDSSLSDEMFSIYFWEKLTSPYFCADMEDNLLACALMSAVKVAQLFSPLFFTSFVPDVCFLLLLRCKDQTLPHTVVELLKDLCCSVNTILFLNSIWKQSEFLGVPLRSESGRESQQGWKLYPFLGEKNPGSPLHVWLHLCTFILITCLWGVELWNNSYSKSSNSGSPQVLP